MYGEIRAALETPMAKRVWRTLAGRVPWQVATTLSRVLVLVSSGADGA